MGGIIINEVSTMSSNIYKMCNFHKTIVKYAVNMNFFKIFKRNKKILFSLTM